MKHPLILSLLLLSSTCPAFSAHARQVAAGDGCGRQAGEVMVKDRRTKSNIKIKIMKKYMYLIICYLNPLLIVFTLGIMQGAWFDAENLLKRNDVEVYTIPQWQYYTYYGVLCPLLLWSIISLVIYYRLSLSHTRYFHSILLGLLYLFLFVSFGFTI